MDRRGRHKTDDEVDELERLRRENLRLKRQLEEKDMVVELLKKSKNSKGCEAWKGTPGIKIFSNPTFLYKEKPEYKMDVQTA